MLPSNFATIDWIIVAGYLLGTAAIGLGSSDWDHRTGIIGLGSSDWDHRTGIIGLVCAGMLAAFMSTHDSYMLCWATVYVEDVINPLTNHALSAERQLLLTRIIILLMGVFLLFWSIWYPLGQDVLDYLAVSGAIYFCGTFAVLLFGLYWAKASRCWTLH